MKNSNSFINGNLALAARIITQRQGNFLFWLIFCELNLNQLFFLIICESCVCGGIKFMNNSLP